MTPITQERLEELEKMAAKSPYSASGVANDEILALVRLARLLVAWKAEVEAYRVKQVARRRESGDKYQEAVAAHKAAIAATDALEKEIGDE